MTNEEFWTLIETTRPQREFNLDAHAESIIALVSTFALEEIAQYGIQFNQAMEPLSSWKHFKASQLIFEYCSDDSFCDFRAGLVALGKTTWEAISRDVDALSEIPANVLLQARSGAGEKLSFAPNVAYRIKMFGTDDVLFEDFPDGMDDWPLIEIELDDDEEFPDVSELALEFPKLGALYKENPLGWSPNPC